MAAEQKVYKCIFAIGRELKARVFRQFKRCLVLEKLLKKHLSDK